MNAYTAGKIKTWRPPGDDDPTIAFHCGSCNRREPGWVTSRRQYRAYSANNMNWGICYCGARNFIFDNPPI